MIVLGLPILLLVGAFTAWFVGRKTTRGPAAVAIGTTAAGLLASLGAWFAQPADAGRWLWELHTPWVEKLGIDLHLAVDGLSLVMINLTFALGLVAAVVAARTERDHDGFFHLNLLASLAGIVGVFLAVDLVVFYLFWELMLIPIYLLIGIWGHARRVYASVKFFIFTQLGGLVMLVGIVGLAIAHQQTTGVLTFSSTKLLGTAMTSELELALFLAFMAAFAVKLPVVGLHTWLPDAHTEAPTAGSIILAGLLLKTGAYGLIRFAVPLFPDAAATFAPLGMALGAAGILWGAWLAFSQDDAKRLVAYTSVSHLGFVLVGVFALDPIGMNGAILEMVCHGFSTGALFVVVGLAQERWGTRDLRELGGAMRVAPLLGSFALFFALASLGLPGLGNFLAEFFALAGAFRSSPVITAIAALGLVGATVYSLWFIQRVFHGEVGPAVEQAVEGAGEESPEWPWVASLGAMALVLILIGLFPQPLLDALAPAVAAALEGVR